jgi:hypothetical protein
MIELTLNTAVTVTVSLILGGIFSYIVAKYRGQRAMTKCTDERLDKMEEEIGEIKKVQFKAQRREIINTYRFYKSKKKIPEYEMEEVEDIYREYSKTDNNGIILKFMEQMRTWTTSEERGQNG